jgi:hypothetical protein
LLDGGSPLALPSPRRWHFLVAGASLGALIRTWAAQSLAIPSAPRRASAAPFFAQGSADP